MIYMVLYITDGTFTWTRETYMNTTRSNTGRYWTHLIFWNTMCTERSSDLLVCTVFIRLAHGHRVFITLAHVYRIVIRLADIEGMLPKVPYLPCVSMAGGVLFGRIPSICTMFIRLADVYRVSTTFADIYRVFIRLADLCRVHHTCWCVQGVHQTCWCVQSVHHTCWCVQGLHQTCWCL